MYKISFTLKQHTPLIHFQHEQEGATLRATEVKPKLDAYLIEKLNLTETVTRNGETSIIPREAYKNWFINEGKQHLALDYKIIITPKGRNLHEDLLKVNTEFKTDNRTGNKEEKVVYKNLPTFFGNLVQLEEFKKHKEYKKVSFYDTILIEFSSAKKMLLDELNNNIPNFFIENNFGTRQSKGFGSFSTNHFESKDYYFDIDGLGENSFYDLFNSIDLFFRTLKSGLNIKGKTDRDGPLVDKLYFKSMMFHYAKSLPVPEQWDKRTIRHVLYINDIKYKDERNKRGVIYSRTDKDGTVHFNTNKSDDRDYFDFRDLLGLSTEQEWQFYKDKNIKKEVNKVLQDSTNYSIDRFKSPITFKPVFIHSSNIWRVYIILNDIAQDFLGANVKVSNSKSSTKLEVYPNFNLAKFLQFAILHFDETKFVLNPAFKEIKEKEIVVSIYEQLKSQLI